MAGKFAPKNEEKSTFEKVDKDLHGKCTAWGCTRWGNVRVGKWFCRYHFACHGEDMAGQLSYVSKILANHEPEINWLEKLQASSDVDWVCMDLQKRIPAGMECFDGEDFVTYRNRIDCYVNGLLAYKKMRPVQVSRKMAAAGDTFNNLSDFVPEFD